MITNQPTNEASLVSRLEAIESEHPGFFDPLGALRKTRHHLPHWHQDHVYAFVTWRLADALPQLTVDRIKRDRQLWFNAHPQPWTIDTVRQYRVLFSNRIDKLMDSGAGACTLRHPGASRVVASTLAYFDGQRYDLEAYVVMPNHIHTLVRLGDADLLPNIVHSWKSYSAKQLAGFARNPRRVWQSGYWDRLVRDPKHVAFYGRYIEGNPENARLPPGQFALWQKPRASLDSW
jgi:hypothetical protein